MLRQAVARRRARLAYGGDFEGGFTLVELMVVIAILGILAAIVVFAVGGITDKGQASACKADRSSLEAAEEAYFAQNGSYTADQNALVSGGFLHEVSTLDTISLGGPGGYTVNGVGKCA